MCSINCRKLLTFFTLCWALRNHVRCWCIPESRITLLHNTARSLAATKADSSCRLLQEDSTVIGTSLRCSRGCGIGMTCHPDPACGRRICFSSLLAKNLARGAQKSSACSRRTGYGGHLRVRRYSHWLGSFRKGCKSKGVGGLVLGSFQNPIKSKGLVASFWVRVGSFHKSTP